MLELNPGRIKTVLCLGAHSDDLEIGCSGTILRLLAAGTGTCVHWHVFSAPGERRLEAQRSAEEILERGVASRIEMHAFRESYFPQQWADIKAAFERIKLECEPHVIFTHWRDDRHQDHRVLSDLTWNTFRGHPILEYEIPKYDGDLGNPNVYVALDEDTCRRKVEGLVKHFRTQTERHWFTEDTFRALMRLRGIESGAGVRYAEAFFGRKLVV